MLETNFTPFPNLTTQRLMLRELTPADADVMYFLRTDARVLKYLGRARAKDPEEITDFMARVEQEIKKGDSIMWAISLKGSEEMIGTICLWNIQKGHYRAEVGYVLHPDHWQQGILSEAMETALKYGFEVMKLHSVEAQLNPGNAASLALLEKFNFLREGYYRENYFFNGKFEDTAVYSLVNK